MPIDGMKNLEKMFRRLGNVPQTIATKSARAGASIPLKAARRNAPVDRGKLKKSIVMKRERTRTKGKSVYDITIDKAMNDVFVKESSEGKRSYYPASQEYGFLAKDGRYIPGYRYLRNAIDDNKLEITKKVLETAGREVEKALKAGG